MFSIKRAIWSGIVAIILDFYAFNFVAKNINIVATRSFTVKVLDYLFNFAMFFVAVYLAVTLIIYFIKWLSPKR